MIIGYIVELINYGLQSLMSTKIFVINVNILFILNDLLRLKEETQTVW